MRTASAVILPLLLSFSIFYSPAHAASAPQCTSAVTDRDGDGWGYESGRSCKMAAGHPTCSSSALVNGSWGFENGKSCIVRNNSGSGSGSGSAPTCGASAIDNGDGWGWENNRSCRMASSGTNQRPTCTSAALNNGDGWGWENGKSCRYNGSDGSGGSGGSDTDLNGSPQCSSKATDNGDGWGYEHGRSCRWGSVVPGSDDHDAGGGAPPPVAAASRGYDSKGKPICLTDASDGNDDGYGYENDRTCTVVSGVTATSDNPLLNTRWCQPWAEISYGDYVLQNNTWNDSDVWTDDWAQCIELGGSRGNYVAKWDYNWLRRDQGNEYSVKSYPQVYYGRKTSNTRSGTPEKLGLPAPVYNLPNYKVRYKYSETGNAERNVALESFFHTSCEAEEWNKQFEMMIWVGKPTTKTPGRLVAEANIDGKDWDVYTNPALSWGYVAFVEKNSSTEGWLDWNKFVNWTRQQGPSYGVWPIGNNTCMGAIEIGTETFWGTGTFTLHEFRVTR